MKTLILLFKTNCLKYFITCIAVCIGFVLHAQTVRQPLVSSYTGLGAYSKQATDVFSFSINPASLANLQQAGAGVYSERRFLLNAFQQYTAVGGFTTKSGNFGLQADYFGFSSYRETQLGLGYARQLGNKVDVGVKFNSYNVQIPVYGNASTVYFEAGALLHLTDKLHAGLSVYNPVGGRLNKTANEKMASVYRGGLGYEVSDQFFISAEMIKEENKPAGLNACFQYAVVKQLLVRAGINTVNKQPYAGVGVRFGFFRIDMATAYHPQLGVSPAVMMLFDFKTKSTAEE